MQGHLDRPLTPLGRQQAQDSGRWFRAGDIVVSRVVSSPLSRAMDTAREIAGVAGFPEPEPLASIKEIDTGIFQGLTFREIRDNHPREFSGFLVDSWESVPRAERSESLIERALATWEHLVELVNRGHRSVLSVTHGGMIQWIVKTSFGAEASQPHRWMPIIKASNCGVFLMQVRPVTGNDRNSDAVVRGYHAQWTIMNHTPGAEPDMGEQFHTDRF